MYGINKSTAHSTENSKWCTFKDKTQGQIKEIRDEYFLEHPEAKMEYDGAIQNVATRDVDVCDDSGTWRF